MGRNPDPAHSRIEDLKVYGQLTTHGNPPPLQFTATASGWYTLTVCAPQWALRALSDAWKRCFKKIAKPPRFKKKGKQDSFTLDGSIKVAHQKIKVPVIGWLKTYERLPHGYQPKSVTISQQANRWFISFKIDVEQQTTEKKHEVVGCDLGVKSLATLSTGEIFEGAKSYRKYEKKLARLQYLNRHKVKSSNNWKKAQKQIAKLHFKIANKGYITQTHYLLSQEPRQDSN